MRDEDKPFICHRRGWNIRIQPRDPSGWRALILWMVPFVISAALFVGIILVVAPDDTTILLIVFLGFLPANLLWGLCMFRWMLARSHIVEVQ